MEGHRPQCIERQELTLIILKPSLSKGLSMEGDTSQVEQNTATRSVSEHLVEITSTIWNSMSLVQSIALQSQCIQYKQTVTSERFSSTEKSYLV